jgi:hypothetical protein
MVHGENMRRGEMDVLSDDALAVRFAHDSLNPSRAIDGSLQVQVHHLKTIIEEGHS